MLLGACSSLQQVATVTGGRKPDNGCGSTLTLSAGDMTGLQLHLKKHARDTGHTPSVKEMLRSPLPAIPPFKGAQLPEDSETTIPAVRHTRQPEHSLVAVRPG